MKAEIMKIRIRKFKINDAGTISQIIKDNFLNLNIGGHAKKDIGLIEMEKVF